MWLATKKYIQTAVVWLVQNVAQIVQKVLNVFPSILKS